jgi:hypothetical protein
VLDASVFREAPAALSPLSAEKEAKTSPGNLDAALCPKAQFRLLEAKNPPV